jgi:hypothetical protein
LKPFGFDRNLILHFIHYNTRFRLLKSSEGWTGFLTTTGETKFKNTYKLVHSLTYLYCTYIVLAVSISLQPFSRRYLTNMPLSFPNLFLIHRLEFLASSDEARSAIVRILQEEPRSVYRREKCLDRLYFFSLDCMHVTCWFDEDEGAFEVVRVKPKPECHGVEN